MTSRRIRNSWVWPPEDVAPACLLSVPTLPRPGWTHGVEKEGRVCSAFIPKPGATSPMAHRGLCSLSLSARLQVLRVCRTWSFRGSRFSFPSLQPKGWGARAPCQRFMGHRTLLALCPKAPQSLHFTCGWRRKRSGSQQKSWARVQRQCKDRRREANMDSGERTEAHGSLGARIFLILWGFPLPLLGSISRGRAGGLSGNRKTQMGRFG